MIAVLLAITVGGVYVGSAVIARHRAQAAADLAALAAAVRVADGTDAACMQASVLARAMNTAVTKCVVEDLDVVVTVETRVPLARFTVGPARATARAGPVEARSYGLSAPSLRGLAFRFGASASSMSSSPAAAICSSVGTRSVAIPA
jgi:secretion/DNA translocation related TadE-like protein